MYIENFNESKIKLVELANDFNNIAAYKVNFILYNSMNN